MVHGHSWLQSPPGRRVGVANPADGGSCPSAASGSATVKTYERGQRVPASWPRNNHPAGFIRWSMVPFDAGKSPAGFEDPKNIFQVSCFQTDCKGNGGDPLAVGTSTCTGAFTIPDHLPDGKYTMQWLWTQGSHNRHGKINKDYVSCLDLEIKGGAVKEQANTCKFIPGDVFGSEGCAAVSHSTDLIEYKQRPSSCSSTSTIKESPNTPQQTTQSQKPEVNAQKSDKKASRAARRQERKQRKLLKKQNQ